MFSYHPEPLSICILTTSYLQDILTNVTYVHVFFSFPGLILYLSSILSHVFHLCLHFLSKSGQADPEEISLVTYEIICLSIKNNSECKMPASWSMFALCRWSWLFSNCSHTFFSNTCVSFSLKNSPYLLVPGCFFSLTY